MRLFSPWALVFLLFIPLVILMYILKQKFEEREVSSVYLWHQVLKDIEVNTPWQKLKKNLLLFLQLLLIILFVAALSDPFVYMKGGLYSNVVIVIDNTGSMNTRYENSTRLEHAKKLAEEAVRNMETRANITLVTMGKNPKVELGKTSDRTEAIEKIRAIRGGNSSGNINDTVSLVEAIVKQYEGESSYKAVFYTDSFVDTGDLNAEVVAITSEAENASLDYIAYSREDDSLKVMVRVSNRSKNPLNREISLYGNEKVLDIKDVELLPGETKTVYFEGVPGDGTYLWAEFTESDDLEEDNAIYGVIQGEKSKKVLLVSQGNIFMEKVLLNIDGIELYKTNPGEELAEGYDLYIYDSNNPEVLPERGSLLFLNPNEGNGIFESLGETEGGMAEVESHFITKYMNNAFFAVSKLKNLETPYWADVLIKVNSKPAVIAGEYKGRKTAAIGFDLNNSDFVLTPEYPIFMYNLTGYLVGLDLEGKASFISGEEIDMNILPDASEAYVKDPTGKTYELELVYPMLPFAGTDKTGIYQVVQKLPDIEKVSSFAVNFPIDTESGSMEQSAAAVERASEPGKASGGTRLQHWIIVLVLILAAAEWMVYIRGY
jgi:hypothetical protein